MSVPQLFSIVGPTACGKTAFALTVADFFTQQDVEIDLIVADSRQVFRGLEIVSGADIPEDFQLRSMDRWPDLQTYFKRDKTRLFGVSLLEPTESWSVGQFQRYAQRVCQLSWGQGRLPVLVGGTGLYQSHVFNTDAQLQIKPDLELRLKLEQAPVTELQELLQTKNATAWSAMNHSDRHNPRRLIRALEKAGHENRTQSSHEELELHQLTIGLTDSIEAITERIHSRVKARLTQGAVMEVERLRATITDPTLPVWSTTGVKTLLALAADQIDQDTCIELWTRQERQYAKRQLTWWKKRPNVHWYHITNTDWQQQAMAQIASWYRA